MYAPLVRLSLVALAVTGATLSYNQAAPDPWPGTRHIVVAKSTFNSGKPPKTRVFTIETIPGGIKAKVTGDEADGSKLNLEYTAKFDGKSYPISGMQDADAGMWRRIDERTIESSRTKGGKKVHTATFTVSPDGKTVTLHEILANGKAGDHLVFEK